MAGGEWRCGGLVGSAEERLAVAMRRKGIRWVASLRVTVESGNLWCERATVSNRVARGAEEMRARCAAANVATAARLVQPQA